MAAAQTLIKRPRIILMDEPFGALDAQTRSLLQQELLSIWQATGKTIVFVTHSLDEALLLADRIIFMSARPGRVVGDVLLDVGMGSVKIFLTGLNLILLTPFHISRKKPIFIQGPDPHILFHHLCGKQFPLLCIRTAFSKQRSG